MPVATSPFRKSYCPVTRLASLHIHDHQLHLCPSTLLLWSICSLYSRLFLAFIVPSKFRFLSSLSNANSLILHSESGRWHYYLSFSMKIKEKEVNCSCRVRVWGQYRWWPWLLLSITPTWSMKLSSGSMWRLGEIRSSELEDTSSCPFCASFCISFDRTSPIFKHVLSPSFYFPSRILISLCSLGNLACFFLLICCVYLYNNHAQISILSPKLSPEHSDLVAVIC